jgi:hypothetical protein
MFLHGVFMHHTGAPQPETVLAALDFHLRDVALFEDLQQLFDFLIGHFTN